MADEYDDFMLRQEEILNNAKDDDAPRENKTKQSVTGKKVEPKKVVFGNN